MAEADAVDLAPATGVKDEPEDDVVIGDASDDTLDLFYKDPGLEIPDWERLTRRSRPGHYAGEVGKVAK